MLIAQGLTGWNLGAGIRSVRWRTNVRNVQTQFNADGTGGSTVDDRIFKTNEDIIDMTFRYSWAIKV
jgi:hypothetical protein